MSDFAPISDDELAGLFAGLECSPLALAVSGGADSMALMHLVVRWARRGEVAQAWADQTARGFEPVEGGQRFRDRVTWNGLDTPPWFDGVGSVDDLRRSGGPPRVVVLTVDHGLREESAAEARFVADEARKLGLACAVLRWDGVKPATGIQEAARGARRRLMCDVIRAEHGLLDDLDPSCRFNLFRQRVLLMAHTMDDQAETVVMRLARGSGLEGLGGMRELDYIRGSATPERPQAFGVMIERPLLDVPKARLVATLEALGARWVEDPSNEDERFERVRVRRMMPLLSELGLSAEKIALSARRLRDAELGFQFAMYADELTERRPAFWHGGLMSEFEIDPHSPFFSGPYVAVRSLRQILRGHGGSARDAELAQLENLFSIRGRQDRPSGMTLAGCKIDFLDCHGRRLRIYREGSGQGLPVLAIAPGQIVDWDGRRFEVSASDAAPNGAVVRALGMQGWADLKKAVPELAELKWPAAAAATLPVVAIAGDIIAYPGVSSVLNGLRDMPDRVKTAWETYHGARNAAFTATFGYVGW